MYLFTSHLPISLSLSLSLSRLDLCCNGFQIKSKFFEYYASVEPLSCINRTNKSRIMVGNESWFRSLWRTSRKSIAAKPEKSTIGILAFEVAKLMTKVVNLWQCLSDFQILRLKEDIGSSFGVRKLVSDDDEYLMDLALAEMIDHLLLLAKSVARLGKKCTDPAYHRLEHVFDDPIGINLHWCGWDYKMKKMESKVKKMERFVAVTTQLHQELEVLAELEQTLRRMKANPDLGQVKLYEFQKKVIWQRQEVKNLREMSPWIRTYDYTVRILLRSLFTIVSRIKHVFGISHSVSVGETKNLEKVDESFFGRSYSLSARVLTSVHPSENRLFGINSIPVSRSASDLVAKAEKTRLKKKDLNIFPLVVKNRRSIHGSFGGCIPGGTEPPFMQRCMQTHNGSLRSTDTFSNDRYIVKDGKLVPSFFSKRKLLQATSSTLGGAGLALHYANVIVLIEKLASAPHLIGLDARDDLYDMLPKSLRSSLRVKLKLFAQTPASSIYDATLAAEWGLALTRIVEWLAPLAHNMISWHSGRNFEKHQLFSETNTLLVQTLYFANQEKTEAAIIELLMGLNYLSRFGGEIDKNAFVKSANGRGCDKYFVQRDNAVYCA